MRRDGDMNIDEIEDLSSEGSENNNHLSTGGYGRWCRRVDNAVSYLLHTCRITDGQTCANCAVLLICIVVIVQCVKYKHRNDTEESAGTDYRGIEWYISY
jgi:hypothetical protein